MFLQPQHKRSVINRRTFLATAASGASVTLAGCQNGSDTNRSNRKSGQVPYGDRYTSVKNLLSLDVDPTGKQPVDRKIRKALDNDTLLYFPPGRYRITSEIQLPQFDHVGLVGPQATIVPEQGYSGYLFSFGRPSKARRFLFEGFTFDFRAPGTGPRAIQARVDDGLDVRDVTVRGRQDTDTGLTRFDVTSADGTGKVTRLQLPDGGKPGTAATGSLVGPSSTGHITFRNCYIAGFPDNGLYASPATGRVTVHGGTFANSGVANVRASAPCLIKGVTVRCNRSVKGITNMRGIRLRGGAGAIVRDSTVEFLKVNHSDGAIVLADETGPARIKNTKVRIDTNGIPALLAKRPTSYEGNAKPSVDCKGLTVTGSAAEAVTVEIIGRPDSRLADVCIDQTGAKRDGVLLYGSGSSTVSGSISVPGQRLVLQQSPNIQRSISPIREGC